MSILNKLKSLNTRKAARLLEVHPLAGESLELRLQYLAGVALATAIDREPSDAERMAFNALADSLMVDAVDAQEQLDERASVTEDDIAQLFAAIRERDASYLYLLDLAWIHAADGELEENEIAVTEELAGLLEQDISQVRGMHKFSCSAIKLSSPDMLMAKSIIPHLIKSKIPLGEIIDDYWLDHEDGTATDIRSGINWRRYCAGEHAKYTNGTIEILGSRENIYRGRNLSTYEEGRAKDIEKSATKDDTNKGWRIPTKSELCEILINNEPSWEYGLKGDLNRRIFPGTYTGGDSRCLACWSDNKNNLVAVNSVKSDWLGIILCRDLKQE